MKQTKLEKALERYIWSSRLLVLLETDDGFVQFSFTPKHFEKVSNAVAKGYPILHLHGDEEVRDVKFADLKPIPKSHFEGMVDFDEE